MKGSEIDKEFRGSSSRLDVPVAPAGNHLARVYGVAYLGPIKNERFNKLNNEFMVFVELLNKKAVFFEGGEPLPYGLSKRFNQVGGDMSNMACVIAPLMGVQYTPEWFDNFDLREITGAYCTASVEHYKKPDGKTIARLKTLGPWVDGVPKIDGVNPDFYYDVKQHGVWSEEWLRIPPWLQKSLFEWNYTYFEQIAHVPKWTKDSKPMFDASNITFLSHTLWEEKKAKGIQQNAENYQKEMAVIKKPDAMLDEAAAADNIGLDEEVDDLPF